MTSQPPLFAAGQEQLTADDYYTPAWVFEAMGLTFDMDVCAPPGGVSWVPAQRFLTMADDGLSSEWSGRVWMNPPYSQAAHWVPKFIEHRHGVCLLPHAKSAWHPRIWSAADGIVNPDHRVNFVSSRSNGEVMYPLFFAAFGPECVEAIGRLGRVR